MKFYDSMPPVGGELKRHIQKGFEYGFDMNEHTEEDISETHKKVGNQQCPYCLQYSMTPYDDYGRVGIWTCGTIGCRNNADLSEKLAVRDINHEMENLYNKSHLINKWRPRRL